MKKNDVKVVSLVQFENPCQDGMGNASYDYKNIWAFAFCIIDHDLAINVYDHNIYYILNFKNGVLVDFYPTTDIFYAYECYDYGEPIQLFDEFFILKDDEEELLKKVEETKKWINDNKFLLERKRRDELNHCLDQQLQKTKILTYKKENS